MPSSTDRSTAQEHELFDIYVTVNARLWQAGCENVLDDLTYMFEDLLDVDFEVLLVEGMNMSDWRKEVDSCAKLRRSANVNYANNMLNSLGWILMKTYGREVDAVPCFQFAHTLYKMAGELHDGEQRQAEARRLRRAQNVGNALSR